MNNSNNKVCCIFNIAPHYRESIYQLMDKELCCDFYFGDKIDTEIKQMDYTKLKGFQKILPIHYIFKHIYWQKGAVLLLFKPYKNYILTGDFWGLSAWMIILLAPLFRKKIYLWSHGLYGKENGIKLFIKKIYFGITTANLIYGERAISRMSESGFAPSKQYCIANSLDYDRQKQIRKGLKQTDIFSKHFGNTNPTVIYVGRLQKIKRIDILIASISKMHKMGKAVNLVLVGGTVDDLDIEGWIKKDSLSKCVWLYGPCYQEEKLAELLYNASVCVSPGNVGLTAIHALSYGCPIITHSCFEHQMPEVEAIIEGVTGSFFKEGDVEDLIEKIKFWGHLSMMERENVRNLAYEEIDRKWNPYYQINIIKKALI